jgi:hypothetical protein
LNLPLYAVEIDVFETKGQQLIVPRGVRYGGKATSTSTTRRTTRAAFLAACEPLAAEFFERMLDEARQKGMIVYWGSVGFSVRMPLEPAVTVMYGYPPDKFQVYTRDWGLDRAGVVQFLGNLGEKAPFSGSGEYTSTLQVDGACSEQAVVALQLVWDMVDELMAGARAEQDQPD